ncbi:MFS general substrate transporter [Trametes versicolor FP-101664 SS1]|uniref:MFS general substrate transporter n=1 Tax=Trametes versicolor (strain FP-101664) TaxID=717944 RepID=UPI0004623A36|nr:MFS general substrate transporter [Trametes versicolor FP-101664 SS1]EIW54811.1 MFS general substrate transporter [Trametes versicolor FP-101664 SS1]
MSPSPPPTIVALPPEGKQEHELVVFERDDPDDPHQWSRRKKRGTVALACLYAFCAVFGSAIYAPGEGEIREKYGVSADVSSTGLTMYVLGFGIAPLICPLSELLGRKIPYHIAWVLLIATSAVSAFVENIAVILLFRFFTGCAAACSLNMGPGVIADMYAKDLHAMGLGTSFCALSGPCFATLFGFFIAANTHGGLWVLRVQLLFAIAVWPLVFIFPETYGPRILEQRAKHLRKAGRENAWAAHELHHKTITQVLRGHVVRPFTMIIYEPIVQGAAIWVTVTYGILYFYFEVYPVVFIVQHVIPFQLCGLLFLSISLGMLISVIVFGPLVQLSERVRLPIIERKGETMPMEETQLKSVIIACLCLPISLFWFAWTSGPETHWIAPALAGIPFGYANTAIFFSFTSYTSRTYTLYASSAAAANTFFRSVVASIFPIIAHSIVDALGTKWGISIFAFISLGLVPIPFVFVRFGPALRARSRHARQAREAIARMHAAQPEPEIEPESEIEGEEERKQPAGA